MAAGNSTEVVGAGRTGAWATVVVVAGPTTIGLRTWMTPTCVSAARIPATPVSMVASAVSMPGTVFRNPRTAARLPRLLDCCDCPTIGLRSSSANGVVAGMASRPGASSSSVCVGWILHLGTNAESRHIYGDRAATEASLMPLGSGTRLLPSGSVADRGGGDAEHRDVVRQVPTVGLVDDVEQAVEQAVDAGLLGQEPAGGGAERLDPEALGRVGRLQPLDQPVRVAEQGPGVADAQAHGLPGVTFLEDPEGGFADRVDDLDCAIGSQQRRRMAGRGHQDLVAVGADPQAADGGEHLLGGPVAHQ